MRTLKQLVELGHGTYHFGDRLGGITMVKLDQVDSTGRVIVRSPDRELWLPGCGTELIPDWRFKQVEIAPLSGIALHCCSGREKLITNSVDGRFNGDLTVTLDPPRGEDGAVTYRLFQGCQAVIPSGWRHALINWHDANPVQIYVMNFSIPTGHDTTWW